MFPMLESKEVFQTKEPKIGDSNLDTRESGWGKVRLGGLKNKVNNTYLEKHQLRDSHQETLWVRHGLDTSLHSSMNTSLGVVNLWVSRFGEDIAPNADQIRGYGCQLERGEKIAAKTSKTRSESTRVDSVGANMWMAKSAMESQVIRKELKPRWRV